MPPALLPEEARSVAIESPPFTVTDVRRLLTRWRWLILGCVAAGLLAAVISSVIDKPTYRATTLLAIEREQENPLDFAAASTRDRVLDPVSFETETRLIKGREVLERVVRTLRLVAEDQPGIGPRPTPGFEPSDAVTRAAIRLQPNVEARPVKGANLVELSAVASSPKSAADLANAVATAYMDWKLEAKFRLLGQASQFLTAQIDEAKRSLIAKEQRLLAFGRKKDILGADPQSNAGLSRLDLLNRDLAAASADRVAKEAHDYELRNATTASLADTLASGLLVQMRADQSKLEREYAEKLNLFKPDWPAMQQLKTQIERGQQHLENVTQETIKKARDAAHAEYLLALRREESLKEALQAQRAEAMAQNADALDYNNLKVEAETQRALVDNLLKRQAEMQVLSRLEGERVSNLRIVERALTPGTRYRPSYRKNGLLGLAGGLFVGILLAFAMDLADRSLRAPDQVTLHTKLPVLGIIPGAQKALAYIHGPNAQTGVSSGERARAEVLGPNATPAIELIPHEFSRSPVAESYRAFRTSLLLSSAELLRSFVVTSAVPLEGKTTTAANLAVVLAQLGKKVLLVDADLHRSRLHEIFHVSNAEGLVSVLTGRIDAQHAVQKTAVPGLMLLTAGPPSPNPSGLLASNTMRRFLDGAIARYEYVVIDAPPVLAVADAIVLGYLSNGVVLCVRAGRTPRDQVIRARDDLQRSNVRILGVVLNGLEEKHAGAEYRERYGAAYYGEKEPPAATPETSKPA